MKDHKIMKRAVLGIDAAWTCTEPSAVALAVETAAGWRLAAVEASYDHFVGRASGGAAGDERPHGSRPDAAMLLGAARQLCGRRVDLVAVDMPMARHPIVGRRPCERRCRSDTAQEARPRIRRAPSVREKSATLCAPGSRAVGYRLCTAPPADGLIEVYPHPALIEFMNETRRLAYKAGKTLIYWSNLSSDNRHLKLRAVWSRIVEALERRIEGAAAALPPPSHDLRGWRLKAYEDKLDAVVCAAVAIAALDGKAEPHGDENAAIWVPVGATVKRGLARP